MANEKILRTRILQKFDSLATWNNSALELKKGEIAFAAVGTLTTDANGKIVNVPTVVMKVGNGATGDAAKFANLPYVSALAADVYSWAKQDAATFIQNFLAMNNGSVESPVSMQSMLDGVFATDAELASAVEGLQGELTEALENYYTKDEIDGMFETLRGEISDLDVGAIEGRVDALETAVETTIPGLINDVDAKFADYTKTEDLDAKVDELGYAKVSELPTKVSELENDSAYLVAADIAGKADSEQVAKDIAAAVAPLATTEALNALAGTHATDKQALEGAIAGVKATADAAATKEYADAELAKKVDKTSYEADKATFAIAETVNAALAEKADKATTYTKEEADAAFATPAEVIEEVNKALAEVSDADSITNITTLVEYVNENAGDLAAIITEVYGTAEMTGDSRIDVAEANAASAVATAGTAAADAAQAKSDAATAVATANEAKTAATEAQDSAAASAAAAKADAEAAASAKADAEAAKGAAESAAATATEEAGKAANSASGAAGSAGEAAESAAAALASQEAAAQSEANANAAKEAAVVAQGAAEAAKSAAETAKAGAETAQGKAEDAQEAAEAARDEAVAAKNAAIDSNTGANAKADAAVETANAAKTAADKASEDVAGLHAIAKTGSTDDLVAGTEVWIFDCGNASV